MKRQRNTTQMKEQIRNTELQINEEERKERKSRNRYAKLNRGR